MYSSSAGTPIMEDWRRYVWAWLAVSTRCIHLGRNIASQIPAPQDTVALAPFLDFLNHSNEARVTTSFDLASRHFVIRTLTPYKRGCEVFISYGPHDNSFMLAEYGFVLAGNPFQGLELDHYVDAWVATARSNLVASTPGRPAAMQPSDVDHLIHTIEQRGLWRDFVLSPGDSDIPYRLHAALRLLIVAAVDPQHRRQPVSLKREIARWERWLHGEHVDDGEASIRNHAIGSWIKTTCRIIADTSTKMIDDICTFQHAQHAQHSQHAQHAQQTKRGRSVDEFLIRCLLVIWKETNAIAVGNKFYHKSQPAI
ncbi:hypothetical protein LPJ72_000846 [Coemansia sp. Benny D160-2]|nr:hypothetical protein LPJ72_000846 [Coemansia sp. Benny D160-2]